MFHVSVKIQLCFKYIGLKVIIYFQFLKVTRPHFFDQGSHEIRGRGEFLMPDPEFLLVFKCNIMSILYRVKVTSNCLPNAHAVLAFSPIGGAGDKFRISIVKARVPFPISVPLQCLLYLLPFESRFCGSRGLILSVRGRKRSKFEVKCYCPTPSSY